MTRYMVAVLVLLTAGCWAQVYSVATVLHVDPDCTQSSAWVGIGPAYTSWGEPLTASALRGVAVGKDPHGMLISAGSWRGVRIPGVGTGLNTAVTIRETPNGGGHSWGVYIDGALASSGSDAHAQDYSLVWLSTAGMGLQGALTVQSALGMQTFNWTSLSDLTTWQTICGTATCGGGAWGTQLPDLKTKIAAVW